MFSIRFCAGFAMAHHTAGTTDPTAAPPRRPRLLGRLLRWRRKNGDPARDAIEDHPCLSVRVGESTVGDNLRRALEAGDIVLLRDGRLAMASRLPTDDKPTRFVPLMGHRGSFRQPCNFLNDFLFDQAYAKAAVPWGCRNCYKVKVTAGGLRQNLTMGRLAKTLAHSSKSGCEAGGARVAYSTIFYALGLDRARAIYREVRNRVDETPGLGPQVPIAIKRGCSNYEYACGPSDRYRFDPALEAVEAHLKARFVRRGRRRRDTMRLRLRHGAHLAALVWRDLLGRLLRRPDPRPRAVTYSPDADRDRPVV